MSDEKVKQLAGKWKHENAENRLGSEWYCDKSRRRRSRSSGSRVNGDQWHVYIESAFKNHDWAFKIGERFKLTTIDGRSFWATYSVEDGVLVEKQETIAGEKSVPALTRRYCEGRQASDDRRGGRSGRQAVVHSRRIVNCLLSE
ncbi:hypothetical protein M3Y99_01444600 [Aphelenchoides fujianensis]|nr:hypothetical protein M3Y99_01444600 [Aphelenchoides fujianensis]